jgi:hypothetical protein
MIEKIEINDWVQHQRFKVTGQVRKIVRSEKDGKTILKVWTDDALPLQTWEEENVKLYQKEKC